MALRFGAISSKNKATKQQKAIKQLFKYKR
jgi:hypothetical protein